MKKIYYDPKNAGGYGGIQRLKQAVFENNNSLERGVRDIHFQKF